MGYLFGEQGIKLFGVIMMYQMTKFMGNDIFNCMVNIYLKEDKYFRAHSDRRRKIFIFANCKTQNKGKTEGVTHFWIRRNYYGDRQYNT